MTRDDVPRGRFVVLDGVDGCGKTTQAARLVRALTRDEGPAPLHLREPGSTVLGEHLRAALLDRTQEMDAGVEALLFTAARRQMLNELVEPALAAGRDVVCERFHPSTFAYQGVAGGLGEQPVLALLQRWAGAPEPDLLIVLELPVSVSAARRGADAERVEDRIEGKGVSFQERVAQGYRRYVAGEPRARCVSAEGTEAEVGARVLAAVGELGKRAELDAPREAKRAR